MDPDGAWKTDGGCRKTVIRLSEDCHRDLQSSVAWREKTVLIYIDFHVPPTHGEDVDGKRHRHRHGLCLCPRHSPSHRDGRFR